MQPQPPFNMLIVGMTGSGKTQFLLDMLEYNRVFDYIIIVCPTIEWNTTYINWSHLSSQGGIHHIPRNKHAHHSGRLCGKSSCKEKSLRTGTLSILRKTLQLICHCTYTTTVLSSKALQREHFQASYILQP
jgi:hypothetical protein